MLAGVLNGRWIRPRVEAGWARDAVLGFGYWLGFVLLLEPGNMLAAQQAGHTLDVGREALRIAAAALLGALATPVTLQLVRSRPVRGAHAQRNLVLHTAACAGVAALLIVVSCPLAAWLIGAPAPWPDEIGRQLSGNWALLFYGLATLTAAGHAVRFHREAKVRPPAADYPAHVMVMSGRRTLRLELAAVDWIESQGNYVALHAGHASHLVRSTLGAMEARLDPARFARIHRRVIVAVGQVAEVTALDGGDADVRLRTGAVLRLSRTYRQALRMFF